MSVPRIAVAAGSLADLDGNVRRWSSSAEIVVGDVQTPVQVAALTVGAAGLIVSLQRLTAEHIAALSESVVVIGRAGVGLDTIDLVAAAARPIAVVYQPDYATNEVADQAMAMLLAAHRRVVQGDRAVRELGWSSGVALGPVAALQDSTAGIIGTGRIGRAMIARLRPFVRQVLAYDSVDIADDLTFSRSSELADVLRRSQVVSLHVPLTADTHHFIGAAELAMLPRGGLLVNVSRGGLIDEAALADALHTGVLGAAALDVFETEPLPANSPLRGAPNLLLSPHVAWYSSQSAPRLAGRTVEDVIAVATGGRPVHGQFAVPPGHISRDSRPPSTTMLAPVMNEAAGEVR